MQHYRSLFSADRCGALGGFRWQQAPVSASLKTMIRKPAAASSKIVATHLSGPRLAARRPNCRVGSAVCGRRRACRARQGDARRTALAGRVDPAACPARGSRRLPAFFWPHGRRSGATGPVDAAGAGERFWAGGGGAEGLSPAGDRRPAARPRHQGLRPGLWAGREPGRAWPRRGACRVSEGPRRFDGRRRRGGNR